MNCIGSTVTAGDAIAACQPAVTTITNTITITITITFTATIIIIIIITTIIIIATIIIIIMITRSIGAGAGVGAGSSTRNIHNNGSWNRNTERMTHTPRRHHTTPTIPSTSF